MGAVTPDVSVVLSVRNRERVVGRAVGSVLDQTFDDLELIVVDGGSSDGTPAAVGSFDDPRLTYVRKPAADGVSAARNEGIRLARGELVAFVDADDRWRPEKLDRQVAALRGSDGDTAVVTAGIEQSYGEPLTREGASGDVLDALLSLSVPTYTSILLVRRDALLGVGGFDEALRCFEDWDLCLRLARDYRFAHVPETLVVKGTAGDHVSADPDALLAALPRLFRRYDLPAAARARLLADAGITCCEAGRFGDGRRHLRRAIRLDPRRPTAALALVLSFASPSTFERGMGTWYGARRLAANAPISLPDFR